LEQELREDAILDDALLAVHVGDERVQRADPLREARFRPLPFVVRDDARDQVERQRAIDVASVGVDRERDAVDAGDELGGELALRELALGEPREIVDEPAGRRPRLAVGLEQLVERRGPIRAPVDRALARTPSEGFRKVGVHAATLTPVLPAEPSPRSVSAVTRTTCSPFVAAALRASQT